MTNIAQVLKAEISRVARNEVRQELESLRTASTHYRSSIAALRREVVELQKQLHRLGKAARNSTNPQASEAIEQVVMRRFSAERLARHRAKLGLSAAQYGQLVGVAGQSVYNWEQGKSRPRVAQLEALAAVRKIGKREAEQRLSEAA